MAGRLPQAWLDELRDRADIVQVVSRYVQLNPKGGRYWGLCPFHGEKTPSFSVNPQRQMYYCFGCHAGGSAITFVMEMEHLDFMEAVKLLAEQVHMEVPELTHSREDAESKSRKERLYEANRQCARFFHAQLWKKESAQILEYLHGRELSDSTIRVFGLGATPPQSDGATRAMRELGFTDDELVSAGISVRREGRVYDMFRQRAIFPIIDAQGRVLGFGGRALGDVKPKYLNTGDTPIFNKRLGVFAANLLKKQRGLKRVILTEGYMDVIALVQAGVPGVCATLGTALTTEQARIMAKYTKKVILSYDSDEAGVSAAKRAIPILTDAGLEVKMLRMEGAKDPDEYIKKFGAARFKTLIDDSQGKLDYLCDSVLNKYNILIPEEKLKAADELCEVVCGIWSDVEREIYITRIAERLSVEPANLKRDVERRMRRKRKDEDAELRRKIVSDTLGYGDRVNRDFVGNAKAARAEEAIIGILLLRPELVPEIRKGRVSLAADDFVTQFNKRVFEAILGCEGKCDIGLLGQDFSVEEIDRITAMQVKRASLTKNDLDVLADNVRTLKSAAAEKNGTDELEDIKNLLNIKKK